MQNLRLKYSQKASEKSQSLHAHIKTTESGYSSEIKTARSIEFVDIITPLKPDDIQ